MSWVLMNQVVWNECFPFSALYQINVLFRHWSMHKSRNSNSGSILAPKLCCISSIKTTNIRLESRYFTISQTESKTWKSSQLWRFWLRQHRLIHINRFANQCQPNIASWKIATTVPDLSTIILEQEQVEQLALLCIINEAAATST